MLLVQLRCPFCLLLKGSLIDLHLFGRLPSLPLCLWGVGGSLCTLVGQGEWVPPALPPALCPPLTATSSSRLGAGGGGGEAEVGLVPSVSALALLYLGFFPFAVLPGLRQGRKQQLEPSEGYSVQANKCRSLAGTS